MEWKIIFSKHSTTNTGNHIKTRTVLYIMMTAKIKKTDLFFLHLSFTNSSFSTISLPAMSLNLVL